MLRRSIIYGIQTTSSWRKVSTIGIGARYLRESSTAEIQRIISTTIERGITLMDTVMNDDTAIAPIAEALRGRLAKARELFGR